MEGRSIEWRPVRAPKAGGPDIALDVWVTQAQEGLNGEGVLSNLLLFHNPDAPSSVWTSPPECYATT